MFGEQLHVGEQRHNQPCDIFVIIEFVVSSANRDAVSRAARFRWIPVFTLVRFRSFGYRRPSAAKPGAGAVGISSLLARSAA